MHLSDVERTEGFSLTRHAARGQGTASAWIALPDRPRPRALPLVAVHGIRRGARSQAIRFARTLAGTGRVVIAPYFSTKRFPQYQRAILPQRADLALLELLERIGGEGICDTSRVVLFGYSGGAQFAHRFAMFYPHRIAALAVLSAGWYTFPDDRPYPYGLAAPKRSETPWLSPMVGGLERFLELPIQVLVGGLDDQADDHTRRRPRLDSQQGTNRLERARRWHRALVEAAETRGIEPRSRLRILPGCGHDFAQCLEQGGAAHWVLDALNQTEAPCPLPGGRSLSVAHRITTQDFTFAWQQRS